MARKSRAAHLAMYGNVALRRVYCRSCARFALVAKDGKKLCCDRQANLEPKKYKIMCQPRWVRRHPSAWARYLILDAQHDRCIYCDRQFNQYIVFRGKWRMVKLNWDHFLPWCHSANNEHENFVASCNFCNRWKGGRMFATVDEVRVYVAAKWADAADMDAD